MDLPADIDTDVALADMGVGESVAGAVEVNTETGEITLGGGLTNTLGAVFFGGDVSLGGSAVCTGGKCQFGEGLRAFFVLDYNGTGDGFTFAVMNGDDTVGNQLGASGVSADRLGYAGDGLLGGLKPPKMALEFDTHVNDITRNDPDLGTSHRDVLQYVFWGDGQANLNDDNIHDTGGAGQKWPPYLPTSSSHEIKTKPVLNSAETSLYFSSKNGYVHELDPETGLPHTGTGFPFGLGGNTESSPALDSDGSIFIGSDLDYLNVITATGSWDWWDYVYVDLRSSPVIDSSDFVYFGDNNGIFHAYNNSCPTPPDACPSKWTYDIDPSTNNPDIKCTPALSPDEATVYFVSTQTDYLYAVNTADGTLKWQFDILGFSASSPTVAPDGTIYVGGDGGSDQGFLFAVNPNGTEKWRYTFDLHNARSKPAVGPDGTIYIGNDDDYLYAITDGETEGIFKWRYHTLDEDGSPLGGDVRGGPMVHDDGTIWFGSNNNRLYVVDSNGLLIDRINLDGDVASPTQGTDGTVYVGSRDRRLYAFKATCNPQNIKTRVFSYDDLLPGDAAPDVVPPDGNPDVTDADNWLNSGPWAVRIEIERSETANARGRYEYTLNTWIRQCQNANCSDITTTYFADTRIDYNAKDPHLEQTVELCDEPTGSGDHSKFDTFLYGFTQATGGATQTVVIDNLNLGFIRPGDAVITSDPNWQYE
jgi:outer membrane protein assembly factor BamB